MPTKAPGRKSLVQLEVPPNFAASARSGTRILQWLFVIFFVQIFVLILISVIKKSGPDFVGPYAVGFDFRGFYLGALDYLHHVDPYLRGDSSTRLYTPPSSILVGIVLAWLPLDAAKYIALIVNVALLLASLKALSQKFGLSRSNELALLGVAATFYPVYYLLDRCNLDGIMLALLVFGFNSKNWFVEAILLGASIAMKVYSGIFLLATLPSRRNWKIVAAATLVLVALQAPFLHLLPSFLRAISGRSAFFDLGSISPAALVWYLFGWTRGWWILIFSLSWVGTLIFRAMKDRGGDFSRIWPVYVPWMITFPATVYPYTGVLALATLALIAGQSQNRSLLRTEKVVITGAALLGFQATAWTSAFGLVGTAVMLVHLVCAIGTLLMVIGTCGLPSYSREECTFLSATSTEVV